jgi:hypothetical protein
MRDTKKHISLRPDDSLFPFARAAAADGDVVIDYELYFSLFFPFSSSFFLSFFSFSPFFSSFVDYSSEKTCRRPDHGGRPKIY